MLKPQIHDFTHGAHHPVLADNFPVQTVPVNLTAARQPLIELMDFFDKIPDQLLVPLSLHTWRPIDDIAGVDVEAFLSHHFPRQVIGLAGGG
ncbi:hypothetical protein D3C72_2138170 [compost metagenome]